MQEIKYFFQEIKFLKEALNYYLDINAICTKVGMEKFYQK